jgi:mRNA interferase MazF
LRRGEVWWARVGGKGRPVLLLSRDARLDAGLPVAAVPLVKNPRGLSTEVPLGPQDGLPKPCAADAGLILSLPQAALSRRLGALPRARLAAVEEAVLYALRLP